MKKVIYLFIYLISSGVFFAGCSEDDESSSLEHQEYESVSGKYNVQGNSVYSSIELGASGNYIIVKSTSGIRSARGDGSTPFGSAFSRNLLNIGGSKNKIRSTTDSGDDILYGTYTVNTDGSINLEGFGKLQITYNGSSVTNMILTPTSGSTITLNVEKEDTYSDSELTSKLCRTWNLASLSNKEYDLKGRLVYDLEGTFNVAKQTWSWNVKVDELDWGEPGEDNYNPSQILFSKSGTYLVYYTDKTAMIQNWKWKSESAGTFYYYEEGYDYEEDDWVTVSFSGKRMTVIEKYFDEESGRSESYTVLEAAN